MLLMRFLGETVIDFIDWDSQILIAKITHSKLPLG